MSSLVAVGSSNDLMRLLLLHSFAERLLMLSFVNECFERTQIENQPNEHNDVKEHTQ